MKPPDEGAHFVHTFEHLDGLLVEQPPGLAEAQRPAATFDQDKAQLIFKLLHLPAQRRLRDVQDLGGAREVSLARNGHEVAEMAKLHLIPPRYCPDQFSLGPVDLDQALIVAAEEVNLPGIG